ncbi:MAG: hypothetical protein ACI9Y1_003611, partial [Lentisphaeria bacterium]
MCIFVVLRVGCFMLTEKGNIKPKYLAYKQCGFRSFKITKNRTHQGRIKSKIDIRFCIWLIVFFSYSLMSYGQSPDKQAPLNVAYIGDATAPGFWEETYSFLKDVAADLNVKIIYFPVNSHREALDALKSAALLTPKPDYAIFPHYFHLDEQMLALAQKEAIPSFVFNSDFHRDKNVLLGAPREKYTHWLGHIFPDDRAVGMQLASMLVGQKKLQS